MTRHDDPGGIPQRRGRDGRRRATARTGGFSLVELLVATFVFSIMLTMLLTMLGTVSGLYNRNRSAADSFVEARSAFTQITSQIREATLQSYWGVSPVSTGSTSPTAGGRQVLRQSDLHFVLGDASDLVGGAASGKEVPGYALFFQRPGRKIRNDSELGLFDGFLGVTGFYVEYGQGFEYEPQFLLGTAATKAGKSEFRLVQVVQPAEDNTVYQSTGEPGYDREWIEALRIGASPSVESDKHLVAENIVALAFRAVDGGAGRGTRGVFPTYEFDSRLWEKDEASALSRVSRNALPPAIEVIMVAITAASKRDFEAGGTPLTPSRLQIGNFFASASDAAVERDLENLAARMRQLRLDHRVFRAVVPLRGGGSVPVPQEATLTGNNP